MNSLVADSLSDEDNADNDDENDSSFRYKEEDGNSSCFLEVTKHRGSAGNAVHSPQTAPLTGFETRHAVHFKKGHLLWHRVREVDFLIAIQ